MPSNQKLPKCPCVYEIRNMKTDRHYIGSSINPAQRRRRHFLDLRLSRHRSVFMQRDFDKCGEHSFLFVVLEETTTDVLLEREQYWMDLTNPPYNSAKVAGNSLGVKHRFDVVEANRRRNKGFGNGNAKVTPEVAELIVSLRSSMTTIELAEKFGVHRTTIERVIGRVGAHRKGYRFVSDKTRAAQRTHALERLLPARREPVVLLGKNNAVIREFSSVTEAARYAQVSTGTMSASISSGGACRGNRYVKRDAAMLVFG